MPNTIYSKDYFLNECEGYTQYNSSKGRALSPRLKKIFELAEIKPGYQVLDIGCGRGELTLHSADKDAKAFGIDCSPYAIELANYSLNNWIKKNPQIKNNTTFLCSNCTYFEFNPNTFDIVFLSDIIEHLNQKDLTAALCEIYKVIKPDGKIILHSSPNKIFLNYGLKLYNILGRLSGKILDWNMKKYLPDGLQKQYHLNEQTVFSIRKSFKKAGFAKTNIWLKKNPHYIYYFFKDDSYIKKVNLLFKFLPIKHLFYADIYGIAGK